MSNPTTPFYPMTHDDAQELIAAIGDNSKIAAAYDSTRTYELNDHCIYSGGLYRCTTAIAVAEQWTPAHWESITVGEELTETSKGLAKLIPVISGAVNNSGYTIASGDYFEADGNLYKATAAIPIGYAWAFSGRAVSGTAINSLNSNFISSYDALTLESGITGELRILRMGKLRSIYGNVKPSSSGTAIVLCTLATTDRPPINLQTSYSGYSINATGEVNVYSDGRVVVSVNNAPSNYLKFSITYATN